MIIVEMSLLTFLDYAGNTSLNLSLSIIRTQNSTKFERKSCTNLSQFQNTFNESGFLLISDDQMVVKHDLCSVPDLPDSSEND